MRSYLIIISIIVLAISSCKKDEVKKEAVKPIPAGWFATQNVRILKVEVTKQFATLPFNGAKNFNVKYNYNDKGRCISIVTSQEYSDDPNIYSYTHEISYDSNDILLNFGFNAYGSILENKYNIQNMRLNNISSMYDFILSGHDLGEFKRISIFNYDDKGFLKKIDFNFDYNESGQYFYPSVISILNYNGNEVSKFKVVSNSLIVVNPGEVENYTVDVSYASDNNIPDDLKRMVNQAILGLSFTGLEGFTINPEYIKNDFLLNFYPNASMSVFCDWIFSFANPEIQTIPAQNIGIVTSKNIKGKRVLNDSEENIESPNYPYIFTEVDSTANFPYIHDAAAKTLEIAGLKIYYELVE